MTGIDRDFSADQGFPDLAAPDLAGDHPADLPLGLVLREPLSSLLKTVRMPPPILNAPIGDAKVDAARYLVEPFGRSARELQATRLVLDLAGLVIRREPEFALAQEPVVRQGFEEVYKFLLQSEHLRMMRQQS